MAKTVNNSSKIKNKGYTLGAKRFAKISAVEGVVLSAQMKRDFREFDQAGLSDDAKRKRLLTKYGKKSA